MAHIHKKNRALKKKSSKKSRPAPFKADNSAQRQTPKLEIVIKCDSVGSLEAATAAIQSISISSTEIVIIHSGVGSINRSDVLMAETGNRLIIGFQVDVLPEIENNLKEFTVEIRLYNVIYRLTADIINIAERIAPPDIQEDIIGSARVIALFKSTRKGTIVGCEILSGHFAVGQHFRIISAMGPVYSAFIESLHIENHTIQKATMGQQAGIKIKDFKGAKIGDLVETFKPLLEKNSPVWHPKAEIVHTG